MQDNVSICTKEKDLVVKYGDGYHGQDREAAWGSYKYILTDMNDIRKSFIRLGYHLAEMQRYRYYEDFGYQTLEDFAALNLGMDKSNVYRYIRVYKNFAATTRPSFSGGLTSTPPKMFLDDKWKDYSFSQLVEMCNMSDIQLEACRPDMSIKQIRDVKKTVGKNIDFAALDRVVKVAMSPQKDRSKEFSYDYCIGLHGAAKAAYVKSRESMGNVEISVFDCDGHRLKLEPLALNQPLDLLYCKDGNYIFRLKSSLDQPDRSASNP